MMKLEGVEEIVEFTQRDWDKIVEVFLAKLNNKMAERMQVPLHGGPVVASTELVLHILRNPYGWDEDEIRAARLRAADLIEQYRDESSKLLDLAVKNGLFATNESYEKWLEAEGSGTDE